MCAWSVAHTVVSACVCAPGMAWPRPSTAHPATIPYHSLTSTVLCATTVIIGATYPPLLHHLLLHPHRHRRRRHLLSSVLARTNCSRCRKSNEQLSSRYIRMVNHARLSHKNSTRHSPRLGTGSTTTRRPRLSTMSIAADDRDARTKRWIQRSQANPITITSPHRSN